tara:strand:- start:1234 stop:2709 length:1476 start_codon:yes stop_codon:yes gene_type:complete
MSKQKLVSFFFERNYMVSPGVIQIIPEDFDYESFVEANDNLERSESTIVLDEEMFKQLLPFDVKEDKVSVSQDFVTNLEVVHSYLDKPKKREVKDFVLYMKARYKQMKKILVQRGDLISAISISKANGKQAKEPAAIIGIVQSIGQTKNGHYMLELEDPTGISKVLVSINKEELIEMMDQIVLDEVIGVSGMTGDNIIFANQIYFPDLPVKEYKKISDDVAVAFISDLHVGSKLFAKEEFEKFIEWINGNYGTDEQREVAMKVKYLIISGDLIDGVGIYPGQQKELTIDDIYGQYDQLAEYLSLIRKDVKMAICGGNHDALRLAEPQPPLSKDFARAIYTLPNATVVSNPAIVKIHGVFDILMYHGYSYDYYINNNAHLRNVGGYNNSLAVMEFMLRKRHVAPTHISSLTIPDIDEDPLVLQHIPDFFVSGHIHYDFKTTNYKNVQLIGACCFQMKTPFQEKLGHENVVYGKTLVVNLKTRKNTVVDFRTN